MGFAGQVNRAVVSGREAKKRPQLLEKDPTRQTNLCHRIFRWKKKEKDEVTAGSYFKVEK